MGIHGIYKEIGPGQRIAISKLAVEHFEKTGRPLRIAIDTSIWLFQIQASKGGTNPALRTFYYRLLRLISLSIHPLFVFDGPNKPPFKRHKRTAAGPNVASIPEFLAKQLLKQFGFPSHQAPGEAEAECALLQRHGVVDAVLSEDVDTLMFGSGVTLRNWSPEAKKSKTPTHVNVYDAAITKEGSGMERQGMILVALMSGGDYVPEGIPGCGPKTACEAARAGFGTSLCAISRRDKQALDVWRERLKHELLTNDSKFFKTKHGKLQIPDDFPNPEILGYYTHPVVSSLDKVEKVRRDLKWDMDIDFKELRAFTDDAFDWTKLGGAKKFIRNLAPALLVRELRMKGEARARDHQTQDTAAASSLITSIHGTRNHASTDNVSELRITFTPHSLVPIDLSIEELDDEIDLEGRSSDDEDALGPDLEAPGSPSKKRAPSNYDPLQAEKLWIFETYVRAGEPAVVQAWEDRAKNARILVKTRHAHREAKRAEREKNKATAGDGGMQHGALDRFTKVVKPGNELPSASQPQPVRPHKQAAGSIQRFTRVTKPGISSARLAKLPSSSPPPSLTQIHRWHGNGRLEILLSPPPPEPQPCTAPAPPTQSLEVIDLLSSSPHPSSPAKSTCIPKQSINTSTSLTDTIPDLLPTTITKRRRSPLRRWQTDPTTITSTVQHDISCPENQPASPCSSLPSPSQFLPPPSKKARQKATTPTATPKKQARTKSTIDQAIVLSSSPGNQRQANLYDYFSPRRRAAAERNELKETAGAEEVESLDLTASPTRKPPQRRRPSSVPLPAAASPPAPPPSLLPSLSRQEKTMQGADEPNVKKKMKTVYRIRESLPGAFAVEVEVEGEPLDLTRDVGTRCVVLPGGHAKRRKEGRRFRGSEVCVLDLTGD